MKNDPPKMPMVWFSTCRGASNPDRDTNRLYYGMVLRIPQNIEDAKTERIAIEERGMRALEEKVLGTSCVENGTPATGEILERYDVYDGETGDILVMYRVPYKASDDRKPHPATTPPPLSRTARRARKHGGHGHSFAAPPNAGQEARVLIGRLMRLLTLNAPDKTFKGPPAFAAEQRALALLTVAASELATMPKSSHRSAIVSQIAEWLRWLIDQADATPKLPEALSQEALRELADQGMGIELGPDEEGKDQ